MKTLTDLLQRAWYGGALWFLPLLVVLWPLSLLFRLLVAARRQYLQRHQSATLPVPVIVVGNISVGGTGKTPLLCALAIQLTQRGQRVGIISRGYGGSHTGAPRQVQTGDAAAVVGDEPLLLARNSGCPVVIGRNRVAALQELQRQQVLDVVLSDDGLQHYALPRTLEIVVIDAARGLGNGFCLPAGPLREPVSRLAAVDCVVVNGAVANGAVVNSETGTVFRAGQLVTSLVARDWLVVNGGEILPLSHLPPGSRVHAVAGIGNPRRFFNTLRGLGLDVIEHPFADHHAFAAGDLQFADSFPVVMTEKDAVKCAGLASPDTYALRVQMVLPDLWVDNLLLRVNEKFRRD